MNIYFNYIYLLALLDLCYCTWAFPSCGEKLLWLWYVIFSKQWLFLVQSTGARQVGFSSCSLQALEHHLSCGAWT